MSRRARFLISMQLPDGATLEQAAQYVLDAVATHRGSLKPPHYETVNGVTVGDPEDPGGDPMFNLDVDTVRLESWG